MAESQVALSEPTQRPKIAEHFREGRFFNPEAPEHGFSAFLRWITTRKIGFWRRWIPSEPGPPPPGAVEGTALRVTFVNHSTVLLQTEGLNILSDPVWSERVSPVRFAGPRRHRAPGIRFEDLPPIDLVLISHNHYDHLDRPTMRQLAETHRPAVFCPLGVADLVRGTGIREVHELDWGQMEEWRELPIHCVPAQHFSSRTPFDRNRTLWCGWVLEAQGGNIYYAGDTGFGALFAGLQQQFAPMRLALLPIGAHEPEWFMGPVHMTPEQAVTARAILDAAVAIPIHFGTFALADDAETAPVERLQSALRATGDADRFWLLEEGEGRLIP